MTWEQIIIVSLGVAVFAVFVERALALVFEHPLYHRSLGRLRGFKEPIALGVSYALVSALQFDAMSRVAGSGEVLTVGLWLTAATIAGGTKGSAKLFADLWDVKSNAERQRQNGGGP